jgi:tripartite-type tricarboxylate transporter receptor subunit TctC
MKRRNFIAASAALGLAWAVPVRAQQLTGDVTFLNGFPPGGTSDLIGRLLANALNPIIKQKVIVEQRTGAGGFIAAAAAARAAPDGHTIFLTTMGIMTITPQIPGPKLPVDVDKELTPISNCAGVYNLLVANPNGPFKTVPELIDYAKKNPGKLTYASAGNGSSQHLSGELFKRLAGVDILHVPYRGGAPAIVDIVAGRTDMMFGNMPEFLGQIRGGGLMPIAFGGPKPSPLFPKLPLISNWLPEYQVSNWFGIVGPAELPGNWVNYWSRALNAAMRDPKFVQLMGDNGMEILAGTPEEFKATIAADRKRWGEVIRSAGIRAE